MLRFIGSVALVGGFAAVSASLPTSATLQQSNLEAITKIATGQTDRLAPPLPTRPPATGATPASLTKQSPAAVTTLETRETLRVSVYAPVASPSVATGSAGPRFSSIEPADAAARVNLVKSIQSELKRAGCFKGAADGRWSHETRAGMDRLVATVNARLPTDTPDFILLALATAERDEACTDRCARNPSHCGVERYAALARATQPPVVVAPALPVRAPARPDARPRTAVTAPSATTASPADSTMRSERETTRTAARTPEGPAEVRLVPRVSAAPRPRRATPRRVRPSTNRRARTRARRAVRVARRQTRRLRPTYRLRPRRTRTVSSTRSSRRFNTKQFWARMNRR